ncbi:MAG TPA: MBL fold metallo-hydrolase [Spirochaetota bacterium]|nr:MBL fold metallo-hydrolase [Spirochaetota bacterium]
MKATIIYDNTTLKRELQPDWGFAALVEAHGKRILFDTGAEGSILLSNMDSLNIDPRTIDDVFISHPDFDHVGGLYDFLQLNSDVTLWIPCSFHGIRHTKKIINAGNPEKMYEGIYSTGELDGIEQSMCVRTDEGIVIIAGCSHPPMKHIIDAASEFGDVYGIIGGLHGNPPESLEEFSMICATHCTMYKQQIAHLYGDKYIEGGAGKIIEIN